MILSIISVLLSMPNTRASTMAAQTQEACLRFMCRRRLVDTTGILALEGSTRKEYLTWLTKHRSGEDGLVEAAKNGDYIKKFTGVQDEDLAGKLLHSLSTNDKKITTEEQDLVDELKNFFENGTPLSTKSETLLQDALKLENDYTSLVRKNAETGEIENEGLVKVFLDRHQTWEDIKDAAEDLKEKAAEGANDQGMADTTVNAGANMHLPTFETPDLDVDFTEVAEAGTDAASTGVIAATVVGLYVTGGIIIKCCEDTFGGNWWWLIIAPLWVPFFIIFKIIHEYCTGKAFYG